MPDYRYLIIGGGMTADAAARGIREVDSSGSVGIIGAEENPPYARPPLSKALWKGDDLDTIWKNTAETGVTLHLGHQAKRLDLQRKTVADDRGTEYTFEKLLLATGGTPRRLPFGGDDVIYYRTLAHFRRLHDMALEKKTFGVIGGGFIGSEIAAALAMNDCKVTMFFPEQGISARLLPADLAEHLVGYYREKGVDVHPGETVTGINKSGRQTEIVTTSGSNATVDVVVAGLGITPNVDLAIAAGLKVDDGILVDGHLQTGHPDVFAAGDVARFHNPALNMPMRVEHEDNALSMGKAAGRAMAGDDAAYTHLPFFYSDLFELGYEAVGEMDPRMEIVADWKEKFRTGVVYYVREQKVRGVLLWNVWGQVDAARQLIAETEPVRPTDLVGRIPTG
jgi:3-phenylpropionate/trans-cinnamate dioxygenase ferredoxin reductase subunit